MTEHKHAGILRAVADGKHIQWQDSFGNWWTLTESEFWSCMPMNIPERYRIAPETVTINGVECPKPTTAPGHYKRIRISVENIVEAESQCFYYETDADARTVYDALCKPFKEGV